MSYILDALRRADAERERDPARGIHAQPAVGVPARKGPVVPAWAWPVAGVAVVAVAALAAWPRFAKTDVAPVGVAAVRPAVADVVPVAAAVMPPAPPPPVIIERVRVVAAPAAAAAPMAKASAPVATVAAAPASPMVVKAPPAAPAAAPAAERIYAVTELPADVQQALPKLAITGGVHSEIAAQRMLVVGGKVFNEGAELAPGAMLDQIRPRSAVIRYRGYKYSVAY
jgi:general secretion pathway protein B